MSETKTFEDLFLSSNFEESSQKNTIKILVTSNLNSDFMYLMKLKEWQIENQEYFDYLIFLGNFIEHKENKDKNDEETITNDESETGGLINYFENITLNLLYIGGENDVKTLFKLPYPTLTINSINLHQSHYKIANDLYFVGYGGQLLGSKYNSFEIFFNNFKYFFNESNNNSNIQNILITNDDEMFDTTKNGLKNNFVEKNKFNNLIKKKDNNILIVLNGSSKQKKGSEKIFNTTIINPGQLCNGEFVILILDREPKRKIWEIQKLDFITL